jgi:RNA polymerase primary sigma factor
MRQLIIEKHITARESFSLDKYLHEISKFKPLEANQEVALIRRIRKGEKDALEELIKCNLKFVVSVSKQYQNQGISLPDLINEGNLGLIKATKRFDETRGFKFISYAVWWIRQSIMQYIADQSRLVRLPLNKIGSISKIKKTYNLLEQKFQEEPTFEEVAEFLNITPELVEEDLLSSNYHVSLDAPFSDENENNLYDLFVVTTNSHNPDNQLMKESLCNEIDRSLRVLSCRDAEIIKFYFGLSGYQQRSSEEIGEIFEITKEAVRQIKEKSIIKLRNNCIRNNLKSYLCYEY